MSKDIFDNTLHINLAGAFYTTQCAARQMEQQRPQGGSIIGISSISGKPDSHLHCPLPAPHFLPHLLRISEALVGGGLQTHYTPTKAGILSLMQSCAVALGKHNIRCNALLPGTIKTQLNDKDLEDDEKRKYMEGRTPLGRTGVTTDMVGPAVFLASEELSGYVVSIAMNEGLELFEALTCVVDWCAIVG